MIIFILSRRPAIHADDTILGIVGVAVRSIMGHVAVGIVDITRVGFDLHHPAVTICRTLDVYTDLVGRHTGEGELAPHFVVATDAATTDRHPTRGSAVPILYVKTRQPIIGEGHRLSRLTRTAVVVLEAVDINFGDCLVAAEVDLQPVGGRPRRVIVPSPAVAIVQALVIPVYGGAGWRCRGV